MEASGSVRGDVDRYELLHGDDADFVAYQRKSNNLADNLGLDDPLTGGKAPPVFACPARYAANTRFSRGAMKSRKARILIGRKRSAA
jgi:hypothetical protein